MKKRTENYEINLTESEVKRGVEEYLQYAKNQGKLWWSRLNAGDIYIKNKDDSMRVFKGAGAGTSDLIVIQPGQIHLEYMGEQEGPVAPVAFVTFVECKSTKGKQSKEQEEFEIKALAYNCRYAIVRSVEDLQEVLKRE